ncbi:hypothetical protein KsCSTR_25760 [Candidatus Kuenenia stuttgartiensis]|uniref:YcfA-like protein n=1 Tax=Kuenenia stuttgartiensis TaxID=174633 RepID=A0A2C9CLE0_KUEST|nr:MULTISPECIES: type II toxin-antitoxin system HicA family toxin [Kuenenia]MBZ0191758.1 type II toxin-antitoxin system HicA family toxin [Candidatus Kuenenia stuttgartiensis]MCL4728659.1 type II toxin-antitoxin system HicA family toxin [Candidatus Kuenenia stuttgartiensis]MCZ7622483.1 type II toxin-antitoxin system HicA family toxin [Candidatus Kuenenia sp.]QII11955.1 hypothetical protein KsCSTR_25760 [Candidatus Kuenenia stuttgartiensis]SOH06476.1 YcfA-like protein [Candidatus Kuenenia stutt
MTDDTIRLAEVHWFEAHGIRKKKMYQVKLGQRLFFMSYKRSKIIKVLREYGFTFLREGGNHTIFTNGEINIPVGRHKEIDRDTARAIAKEIQIEWEEFKRHIN